MTVDMEVIAHLWVIRHNPFARSMIKLSISAERVRRLKRYRRRFGIES